nr:hypothetical protein [Tanacetum cinerariifolium]
MSIEIRKKEKLLQEEQWAYLSTHPSKRLTSFCFNDDVDDEDYTSAITPDEPSLSNEELDNSLSMGDEHLDTISATESDKFIKSGVENLIPIPSESEGILEHASPSDSELVSSEVMEIVILEVGGIDDDILLMIKDDILREKLLNVNLLISKIEALNANPTPSSDCKTKSSSTSLNSLLEETNNFDNSLPEFENLCFNVEEISSGSTTTHPDISLPEYEAFHDDHVKEISSGSPTTHFDSSLYALFIFDLSINPFPPADRSDSNEFTDELIPFISPPEYDCFLFKIEPNSRDFTKDVMEDVSPIKVPQVLITLPTHPTLQLNMKFQPLLLEYMPDADLWTEQSFLGCSSVPFLSPLIRSKISSGSTTTHHDTSLPEYEAFYDDHVKEISSSSPTNHSDSLLYASFIFDLSINPFPPADRSDFYEFTDELIPFISPPEYDFFLFKVEPNSGDFTKDVVEDITPTKEPQVHNALTTHPTLQLNLKF